MSYIKVTEARYQQAIRDRMIVEMINKIIQNKEYGYVLSELGKMMIDVQADCQGYESEMERYPDGALFE